MQEKVVQVSDEVSLPENAILLEQSLFLLFKEIVAGGRADSWGPTARPLTSPEPAPIL